MAKSKAVQQGGEIYKLRIWVNDITPRIVRRVEVPGSISLPQLHGVFQLVMGWQSSHLFAFMVGSQQYGIVFPDFDDGYVTDCTKMTLADLGVPEKKSFRYDYDFGDGWEHDIRIEKISAPDPNKKYPLCLSGKRACPPEDSGGPWYYQESVEKVAALRKAGKPLPEELEWSFGDLDDTEYFDLKEVQDALDADLHIKIGEIAMMPLE